MFQKAAGFGIALLIGGAVLTGCAKSNEEATPAANASAAPVSKAGAGMPTPDEKGNIPGISKDKSDPVGPK